MTSQLSLVAAPAGAAAGTYYEFLRFTNTGGSPCTLDGHPGVSYVAGNDGHQVGASAQRTETPKRVLLAPGAQAHASLGITNYQNYNGSPQCAPTKVRGLRVYPPDQTASLFLPMPDTACGNPATVTLTIFPVKVGAGVHVS